MPIRGFLWLRKVIQGYWTSKVELHNAVGPIIGAVKESQMRKRISYCKILKVVSTHTHQKYQPCFKFCITIVKQKNLFHPSVICALWNISKWLNIKQKVKPNEAAEGILLFFFGIKEKMSDKLMRVARQKTELLTPDLWFCPLKLIPLSNATTSIFTQCTI